MNNRFSYSLDLANSSNIYYADNPIMFNALLNRVINNPQHYAPTKSVNQPLRNWMNNVTHSLGIKRVKAQVFVILQGITQLPHCKCCGKQLSDLNFKDTKHGFREFCCHKCQGMWQHENWTIDDHLKLSQAVKNGYANLSSDRRDEIRAAAKERAKDHVSKQKRIVSYRQTIENRSDEEKQIISKHISDAYHNMSEEQKKMRNEHLSYSLRNMNLQKKMHKNKLIGQKNHQNWQNKTEEEKQAYREVRRIAAAKRSQETIDNMVKACTETKRKNKSFNTSKPEEEAFQKLVMTFGNDNVIRQYKCDRYPFNCDFYVKSLDVFIECNYFWQHYKHPFNPNCEDDIKTVEKWKSKSNDHIAYKRAIYVWTQLDVKKQHIAKDNNLNYRAFYSPKDFNAWINSFTNQGALDNEKTI